jgi:hypothetical protein
MVRDTGSRGQYAGELRSTTYQNGQQLKHPKRDVDSIFKALVVIKLLMSVLYADYIRARKQMKRTIEKSICLRVGAVPCMPARVIGWRLANKRQDVALAVHGLRFALLSNTIPTTPSS